jgi:beta-glucosidase
VASAVGAPAVLPYLDITKGWNARTTDLVARLSLQEKVMLLQADQTMVRINSTNNANGAVVGPYVYGQECNSGIGVEYPQNINMAATFNRTLVFHAGRGAGSMLRAHSNTGYGDNASRLSCWSPMMNIARHPLWGRNHEGYGEDPYLSGELAFQNVRGLQGHGLPGYPRHSLAAAGCKHFAAFDGPFNEGDSIISNADEFWNYMPNFEQCVNAGSWSLMCTYAKHDDRATNFTAYGCENHRALTTVLRDTWTNGEGTAADHEEWPGIAKGFVASDCGAIHNVTKSLQAGCDISCESEFSQEVPQLVQDGALSMATIDQAVGRMVYVRMRLGEWDPEIGRAHV